MTTRSYTVFFLENDLSNRAPSPLESTRRDSTLKPATIASNHVLAGLILDSGTPCAWVLRFLLGHR